MLKEEFELMIGKKVSCETFEQYNKMYSSCEFGKQEFIKLLNIDAIPENKFYAGEEQRIFRVYVQDTRDGTYEQKYVMGYNMQDCIDKLKDKLAPGVVFSDYNPGRSWSVLDYIKEYTPVLIIK